MADEEFEKNIYNEINNLYHEKLCSATGDERRKIREQGYVVAFSPLRKEDKLIIMGINPGEIKKAKSLAKKRQSKYVQKIMFTTTPKSMSIFSVFTTSLTKLAHVIY